MKMIKVVGLLCLLSSVIVDSKILLGYYTDYAADLFPPSAVTYKDLTHINYAFAMFDNINYTPTIKSGAVLTDLVTRAHANDTKVLISIGGWGGSMHFSSMSMFNHTRTMFIEGAIQLLRTYNLDGIDIDWEFPGRLGDVMNEVNVQLDTSNFLVLLKELKQELIKRSLGDKLVTLAVRQEPFDGPDGPMKDVYEFGRVVDYVGIMAYDVFGSEVPTTGPNAPLHSVPGQNPPLSVSQAGNAWNKAGIPREKIVLGVPFYGRLSTVDVDMSLSDNMFVPHSSRYAKGMGPSQKILPSIQYKSPDAALQIFERRTMIPWSYLMTYQVLTTPTVANGTAGWIRKFDNATQTPWLFHVGTKTFVSYDDPQSLEAKAAYSCREGYGGLMIWALDHDNGHLLSSLSAASQCQVRPMNERTLSSSPSRVHARWMLFNGVLATLLLKSIVY
ncbi:glycoside hydrolase [Basidiobolus meristosporus CBS 931.73]|uniref:Glycoside hydrolase n=1 Tax=Basidiobolus meristosporus CBS 931.73 TaxID=1314790 RepID=A0A1Y1YPS1_9FUNG|nr:glycoside hydrolase [Basidiobolus meristosporus CBS 931.73]|eukprot:ORY00041.1 glycoside hydrolase [Basidiobolus meristosporus CBS 931.73]